ncbi:hypothetical protein FJD19_24625, partial [Escherichia coli]|nr:hypothetical protein [Escherichia coli]
FPGASSLIRSLRSVMRLRRALPAQSCGKQHHCRTERGKTAKKPSAQKNARKALLSDIGYFPLFQFRMVRVETSNIAAIAF